MPTVDGAASVGPVFGLIPIPVLDRLFRRPLCVLNKALPRIRGLPGFDGRWDWMRTIAEVLRGDTRPVDDRLPAVDGSAPVGPCLRLHLPFSVRSARSAAVIRAYRPRIDDPTPPGAVQRSVIRAMQRSTSDTRPAAARWALKLGGLTMADVLHNAWQHASCCGWPGLFVGRACASPSFQRSIGPVCRCYPSVSTSY
jgi:hypothetical protein